MGRQVRSRDLAGQSSGRLFRSHPFEVAGYGHDAALFMKRPLPQGALFQALGSGVERAALGVNPRRRRTRSGPSASARSRAGWFRGPGARRAGSLWVRCCNRERRKGNRRSVDVEGFGELLFICRPVVAPAHYFFISRLRAVKACSSNSFDFNRCCAAKTLISVCSSSEIRVVNWVVLPVARRVLPSTRGVRASGVDTCGAGWISVGIFDSGRIMVVTSGGLMRRKVVTTTLP